MWPACGVNVNAFSFGFVGLFDICRRLISSIKLILTVWNPGPRALIFVYPYFSKKLQLIFHTLLLTFKINDCTWFFTESYAGLFICLWLFKLTMRPKRLFQ